MCTGACAANWPPLLTHGAPLAGPGTLTTLLGTTNRADGTVQVTYNGHPLYYFVGDRAPGQTNGEALNAFGDDWYVLGADGDKIEPPGSS
jgi:predicted lipoprotein with Yx(FWY)xxD motif